MRVATALPVVRLSGDPHEMGRRHGAARTAELRHFLDDDLCRLNRLLPRPTSLDELAPAIAAYREAIGEAVPALAEEIEGLAAGAGIAPDEAVLLQVRREVLGYRKVPAAGDCTTYARAGGAGVLAQTVDLNGDLDDQAVVLETAPAGGRRALLLSFGGLLGYLGVNEAGLAVGLNLVLGGEWRPGLPPYLAIRHLLDTAGDVGEALALLAGLRLASSRSLTLCDGRSAAAVEILGDELRVVERDAPAHTNHFLDPQLARGDELNVFARNSSLLRLQACRAGLAALEPAAAVEDHFALLGRPPIHVADTGDPRRERTVATAVMVPGRGELHVRTPLGAAYAGSLGGAAA